MRLPRLAVGVASLGLAETLAGRLAIVVGGAAATTSCEPPCEIGPVSPATLPDGQVGKAYFFQLHVPWGESCPGRVEFSLVNGNLPRGMKLSKDGALDGTPSQSGAYDFKVMASIDVYDSHDESAPKFYTLTILP